MSEDKDLKDRVIKLEDERMEKLYKMVEEIHCCLFGNGAIGLKGLVLKQGFIIKGLLWAIGIVYTSAVGYVVVAVIKHFTA